MRGFSLFKDDFLHLPPDDEYGHALDDDSVVEEAFLSEDRPGGVAYKDVADWTPAHSWAEHDSEDHVGTVDKDAKMYLRRKRRLKSSKGMYVASPICLS